MNPPWSQFDLSLLSYQQFLEFFFDRPIVGDENEYDLFRSGIDSFVASNPTAVVAHIQAMCRNFAELTNVYSHEQLDQGLWAIFGVGISCERYLFDSTVESTLRMDCIESMYLPFKDVAACCSTDISQSFYWMWWDMILHTFWQAANTEDYSTLNDDQKQMADAMYQTLSRILALDHRGCQWCSLHGLGHLHHPSVQQTVQNYLNVYRSQLSDEDVQWIEACRDGSNL
ncbi:MAG TPA: hypothetical protein VK776_17585 [Bryobacteraceae bacterium]|jgi:hypothetical protein|nr:hypothetical protein [Bryobacteraceae bacterium]